MQSCRKGELMIPQIAPKLVPETLLPANDAWSLSSAGRNQRWSLDFASDTLVGGRRLRILTLVDDLTLVMPRHGV